jgi:O-antigen/teichoic acid export membrane protein
MSSSPSRSQPERASVPRRALGEAALSGVRWIGAARVAAELAGFVSMIVMARLVPPAAFGAFAVASVVSMLAGALGGDGLGAALVQRGELRRAHQESAMFLALAAGAAAALLTLACIPLADALFGGAVADLLPLAATFFPVTAVAAVSQSVLERRLDFRRVAAIDAAAALAGAAAAVGLAVAGLDASALLLGALAGQVALAALLLAAVRPPRPWPHRRELREIVSFGLPNMAAGAASIGAQNVDYAVLAARASPATVGFYWRGFRLGVDGQRKLSGVLMRIALPLYARSESADDRRALRARIVRLQTLLLFPLLAGLILLAPVLVPALFGERWTPAVVPTQLLAVAGMVSAAQTGIGPLVAAVGRPDALLRWNLTNICALSVVVYLAAPEGLTAVCVAVVGLRLVRFWAAHEFLLRRLVGIPVSRMWRDSGPALVAAAIALAAASGVQALVLDSLPEWLEVPLAACLLGAAYALALRVIFPSCLAQLLAVLRRLLTGGSPA